MEQKESLGPLEEFLKVEDMRWSKSRRRTHVLNLLKVADHIVIYPRPKMFLKITQMPPLLFFSTKPPCSKALFQRIPVTNLSRSAGSSVGLQYFHYFSQI